LSSNSTLAQSIPIRYLFFYLSHIIVTPTYSAACCFATIAKKNGSNCVEIVLNAKITPELFEVQCKEAAGLNNLNKTMLYFKNAIDKINSYCISNEGDGK
jgi:hypothetical protein